MHIFKKILFYMEKENKDNTHITMNIYIEFCTLPFLSYIHDMYEFDVGGSQKRWVGFQFSLQQQSNQTTQQRPLLGDAITSEPSQSTLSPFQANFNIQFSSSAQSLVELCLFFGCCVSLGAAASAASRWYCTSTAAWLNQVTSPGQQRLMCSWVTTLR